MQRSCVRHRRVHPVLAPPYCDVIDASGQPLAQPFARRPQQPETIVTSQTSKRFVGIFLELIVLSCG